MKNQPEIKNCLVSCIIIFLNAEKFLREAVESILSQTYSNLEIIMIDDGSSDQSSYIARNYCRKYPDKIFYYDHEFHENLGMSASRNLGISKSKGEFITFLDADDIWLSQKLEEQIKIMNMHPKAAMVYGRALVWYNWDNDAVTGQKDYFPSLGVNPENLYDPPELFYLLLENKAQTPMTSNVMLRKKVFSIIGGFEDQFTSLYEDQVFFSKINLNFPVYVSDQYWIKYRQHNSSCTASINGTYWEQRRTFLLWLYGYLSDHGLKHTFMMKAVKREMLLSRFPRIVKLYIILRSSKTTHKK